MAFSNTPTQSTYQQKRVSFYKDNDVRFYTSTKDRQYLNVFVESEVIQATGEKKFYLKKRGGTEIVKSVPTGEVRGAINYEQSIYFVVGNFFYEYTDGTLYLRYTFPNPRSGRVGLTIWNDSLEVQYIILGDGIELFQFHLINKTMGMVPAGYPTPFLPMIHNIDGYLTLVKTNTSDIYNSQVEDLSGAWDFITAEMYPDTIIAFGRYNNYLAAFGRRSLELFYDAAIESGSPFARNDSTVITVGCAAPSSVVQTEKQLIWVGNAQEGELGVWMLEDFKISEISSVEVKQDISSIGSTILQAHGYVTRHYGHRFYILVLPTKTWVYDITEKIWTKFNYQGGNWPFLYGADNGAGVSYLIGPSGLYQINPLIYRDSSVLIDCWWTTDPLDFDTLNRKVGHRLGIVGNIMGDNSNYIVTWSDDDYQTWSSPRTLSMNLERPAIVNLGNFRRRAFKFQYLENLPMRIEGLELYYNLMSN